MSFALPVQHSGTSLGPKRVEHFAAGTAFRPMRDQLVVKVLPWQPSAVIELAGDKKAPMRGVVAFAGRGHYPLRYKEVHDDKTGKINRTKSWESKAFQPCDVKVGDLVEFGALDTDGDMFNYDYQEIMIGNEVHIVCREADVCGVGAK